MHPLTGRFELQQVWLSTKMEETMSEMGLAEAIRDLRKELGRAMQYAKDEELQFKLGPIDLELEMVLMANAKGTIGFKWVVVSLGGEVSGTATSRHRIKVTLTPMVNGQTDIKVSEDSLLPI
jgi:hypothetical protein